MFQQFGKIFLGTTPSAHRKFITEVFKELLEKYPKLVIPCAGQFTLTKCAIEAGYKRENIENSDITIFSNILGCYYSGQPVVETLGLKIDDERFEKYQGSEEEKVAFLLWLIKLNQLNSDVIYEKMIYDGFLNKEEKLIEELIPKLKKLKEYYFGIKYTPKDVREEIAQDRPDDTLMIVNPPVFKGGYGKMFDTKDAIKQDFFVEEFDFKKEYFKYWEESKKKNFPIIWYRDSDSSGFENNEIIFANQVKSAVFDYWVITKPEVLKGFKELGKVVYKKETIIKPYKNAQIWSDKNGINEGDRIDFVGIPKENALYYRDLFAHRLGSTKAERYYLVLLDGRVFGTVGFMTNKLFRLQQDAVFENFGFSAPSKLYPNKNRLLMRLITCHDMKNLLISEGSKKNRLYTLRCLRTACLTKYRTNKLDQGILKLESREKRPDGMYHLMYEAEFRPEGFDQCIVDYLKEYEEKFPDLAKKVKELKK